MGYFVVLADSITTLWICHLIVCCMTRCFLQCFFFGHGYEPFPVGDSCCPLLFSISFPSSQMKDIGYNMAACLTRLIIDKVFVSSCNVFFFLQNYYPSSHLLNSTKSLTPHLQVNWTHTSMQLGFSATNIIQVELTSGTLFPADI